MNEIKTFQMQNFCELPENYYEESKRMSDEMNLGMTADEAKQNSTRIRDMYECLKYCESCCGLDKCVNEFSGGTGYQIFYKSGVFSLGKCEKRKEYERNIENERLLDNCRIPEVLRHKSMKTFIRNKSPKAYDAACEFIRHEDGKGIILYGSSGTGKTHLCAAMLNNYIIKGGVGIYATLPDLMDSLRSAMKHDHFEESIKAVVETNLLFMDDIGTETPSDFVIESMFKIINGRYLNGKRIIGTMNLNPDNMADHYGELTWQRMNSRLREMCDFYEMSGEDERLKKA